MARTHTNLTCHIDGVFCSISTEYTAGPRVKGRRTLTFASHLVHGRGSASAIATLAARLAREPGTTVRSDGGELNAYSPHPIAWLDDK